MRHGKRVAPALLVLATAAALAACGGDESATEATGTGHEVETVSGRFAPLPGAPPAYSGLSGEAELTRTSGGTTVSLSLAGLEPRTAYLAHLHTGGCDQPEPGGPHFQLEKGGSEEPPNEIHLEFLSNEVGDGEAEVSSSRQVPPGEAGSVVLHLAAERQVMAAFVHEGEHHGDRGHDQVDAIACADLEGSSSGEAEAGGEEGATGAVPTIVIRDGEPVGGVQELEFDAGDEIRFRVSSDAAEEIHVHGYDIAKDVPAGGTVEFAFPAEIEGIFEAELEELGVQIAELRVNP